jgi:uncharacterized membrane protein HdeD (DUF308 family)
MPIQLALLLLGPSHFKYEWKLLLAFGLTLACFGAFVVWDASDKTSYFIIDALGFFLLAAGILEVIHSAVSPWNHSTPFKLSRAATLIVIGIIVAVDHPTINHFDELLLGSAFIILGIFKLFFSLLTKYPHWKIILLGAVLNLMLGLLFLVQWEGKKHWMIPFLFGCAFILMGIGAVSNAWILRKSRFLVKDIGEDIGALDYFLRYHVSPRYRQAFKRLPSSKEFAAKLKKEAQKTNSNPAELLLRIWMPAECVKETLPPEGKVPLLSRYLLVRDKKGCVTVGHSSMQISPDLYISHTDKNWYQKIKNKDFKQSPVEDFRFFEEMKAHDEEGAFFESYEEEAKHWMPATRTIKMLKFNEGYLRLFENFYKMDSTYNFAVRNCSVCIAMGLDMALLGCLGGKRMILRFIRLLFDQDLWLASFIRKRAEDMAWSPGLIHDYAIIINRLIKRHADLIEAT